LWSGDRFRYSAGGAAKHPATVAGQWRNGQDVAAGEFCIPSAGGVDLVEVGHEELQRYLPAAPQGIIANLGYLPGGDRRLVTRPLTTLAALQQSCDLLAPGGRLVVVVYPGHPGGVEEGLAADGFFAALEDRRFQVLQLKVLTRPEAPYLLVAEKCC